MDYLLKLDYRTAELYRICESSNVDLLQDKIQIFTKTKL